MGILTAVYDCCVHGAGACDPIQLSNIRVATSNGNEDRGSIFVLVDAPEPRVLGDIIFPFLPPNIEVPFDVYG